VLDLAARRLVPAYPRLRAAAGPASEATHVEDGATDASVALPIEVTQGVFAVRAAGDSMDGGAAPFRDGGAAPIRDGDWVVLRFCRGASLGKIAGRVALVQVPDAVDGFAYQLKRIVRDRQPAERRGASTASPTDRTRTTDAATTLRLPRTDPRKVRRRESSQPSVCDCVPFVPGAGALFFLYSADQLNAEFFAGIEMTAEALEAIGYATDLATTEEPDKWLEALTTARVPGVAGHLYMARAAVRAQRWERAEAELEAALALSPLNVHALKELGWVATRLGDLDTDPEQALRRHRRALDVLERLPESARERRVRLMYASVLARNGRHDDAEKVLAVLIAEEPGDADAWLVRAGMRRHSRPEDAWGDFEQAAALGSEFAREQLANVVGRMSRVSDRDG